MGEIFPFRENFSESEIRSIILWSGSIIASLSLILVAIVILPEYCSFFSRNELHGLACDGMRDFTIDPCPICENKGKAIAASVLLGLGLGLFGLPIIISQLVKLRNQPQDDVKLFPN